MKKISVFMLVSLIISVFLSIGAFAQTQTTQNDIIVTDENGGTYTIISEELTEIRTRAKGDTWYYEVTITFDPADNPNGRPSNSYPFGEVIKVHNGEIYRGYLTLRSASRNPLTGTYRCVYGGTLKSTGLS